MPAQERPSIEDYPLEGVCSGCFYVFAFVKRVYVNSLMRSEDAINTNGIHIKFESPIICGCTTAGKNRDNLVRHMKCLRERKNGTWLLPSEHTDAIDKHERLCGRRLLK